MSNKITPQIKKIIEENALALAMIDLNGRPWVIGLGGCIVTRYSLRVTGY